MKQVCQLSYKIDYEQNFRQYINDLDLFSALNIVLYDVRLSGIQIEVMFNLDQMIEQSLRV